MRRIFNYFFIYSTVASKHEPCTLHVAYTSLHIYKVASVQINFTKRLRGMSDLSYSDRLAALNLPSLELRRLQNDVIWCYKILFGVAEMPEFSLVKRTRGHCFKLFKRCSNTCAKSSFFSVSV